VSWIYWSLLFAAFAALTALFAKLGVKSVDANLVTAVRTSIVLLIAWRVVALPPAQSDSRSRSTWLFLLLSGVATGLSGLCYFHALQTGPLNCVAPVDKLSVALGMAVLDESISKQTIWDSPDYLRCNSDCDRRLRFLCF
jgi:bacterial/archaeal transporter family protein